MLRTATFGGAVDAETPAVVDVNDRNPTGMACTGIGVVGTDGAVVPISAYIGNQVAPEFLFEVTGAVALIANLATFPEALDNAVWTKTRSSITANAVAAPDSTLTADKLVEDATASNSHQYNRDFVAASPAAGIWFTYSVFAKAGERQNLWLQFNSGGAAYGVGSRTIHFNLLTGQTNGTPQVPVGTQIGYGSQDMGNGWWRLWLSAPTDAAGAIRVQSGISNPANPVSVNYSGDGVSGLHVWGAKLEQTTSPSPYAAVSSNLLSFPEDFSNAYWSKTLTSIVVDTTADPLGGSTADFVKEDNTLGAHRVTRNSGFTLVVGLPYTVSVFAKAKERSVLWINLADSQFDAAFSNSCFDLVKGVCQSAGLGIASMQYFGNGWWRLRYTATCIATGSAGPDFHMSTNYGLDLGTQAPYQGDGASGLYLWGAKYEQASAPSAYV